MQSGSDKILPQKTELSVTYLKKQFYGISSRTNPTIAAMEIMTRKEIKQGEMEERRARGEVIQIPVPPTPLHMKGPVGVDQNEVGRDALNSGNGVQSKFSLQEAKQFMEKFESKPLQNINNAAMLALLEQQTHKLKPAEPIIAPPSYSVPIPMNQNKPVEQPKANVSNSLNSKEQPKPVKKVSAPNPEVEKLAPAPVIILKKEPKRLDPNELKARVLDAEKSNTGHSQLTKRSSLPANHGSELKPLTNGETEKGIKKVTNADKVAEALRASKAQTAPKFQQEPLTTTARTNISSNNGNGFPRTESLTRRAPSQTPTKLIAEVKPMSKSTENDRKRDSDEISESEFSRQNVKKAAEKFEKVALEEATPRAPPPSLSSLGPRGRSKSIGHSLAQKLQEAEDEIPRPVLPWAAGMSTEEQVNLV